jgi:hypothetical protein
MPREHDIIIAITIGIIAIFVIGFGVALAASQLF